MIRTTYLEEGWSEDFTVATFTPKPFVVAALVILAFAFNYSIAVKFWDAGLMDGWDIILEADAESRLRCFRQGAGGYGRSFSHPNVCGLVHLPVKILAKLATLASGVDYRDATLALSLAVSPLASALSIGLVFLIACELGFSVLGAFLFGLFFLGVFSQVIYGSVPEFFNLGGMSIALALYVATISHRLNVHSWVWVLVATFAGSITITNLAPVAGVCLLANREEGNFRAAWSSAIKSTAKICVSAVVLIVLSTWLISVILDRPALSSSIGANPVTAFKTYLVTDPVSKLASFPHAIGNSILPDAGSIRVEMQQPTAEWLEADYQLFQNLPIKFIYVMPDKFGIDSRAMLVFLLVLSGIFVPFVYRKESQLRARLALSALLILLFNGFLHSIWGEFYFLYSPHWQVASAISIMLLLSYLPKTLRTIVGIGLPIAVFVISMSHLEQIFAGVP